MYIKVNKKYYLKEVIVRILLLLLFTLFFEIIIAQDLIDHKRESVKTSLYNFSYVYFNVDFYKFTNENYLLSQVGNGVLKINMDNYIDFEYNISNSWMNNSNYVTAGDFSIAFTHNFYAKNYLKKGFQGLSAKIKLLIPTGKSEYLSGLDNWIIEPLVYFGWRFNDDKTFFIYRIRYNYSIGSLPNIEKPSSYLRYEPILGYENDKFWIASTGDNRVIIDKWQYTLLMKLEIGLKIRKTYGIFSSITYRVLGNDYYKYYLNFGYYRTF